jgi:hypothetical protein
LEAEEDKRRAAAEFAKELQSGNSTAKWEYHFVKVMNADTDFTPLQFMDSLRDMESKGWDFCSQLKLKGSDYWLFRRPIKKPVGSTVFPVQRLVVPGNPPLPSSGPPSPSGNVPLPSGTQPMGGLPSTAPGGPLPRPSTPDIGGLPTQSELPSTGR